MEREGTPVKREQLLGSREEEGRSVVGSRATGGRGGGETGDGGLRERGYSKELVAAAP